MKRTVIISLCVVAVCLLATQAWSQAHYYMTPDMGNFKAFDVIEGDGTHMDLWPLLEMDGWTHMRYRITGGSVIYQWTMRYSLDDEGNLWQFGMVENDEQPAEPILWLDAPLYAGKAWEQTVNYPGYGDYHSSHVCEAEEEVTVPFGTFWCFRVRHSQNTYGLPREDVMWYCDGIGLVKWQFDEGTLAVLANGQTVIPVENTTWGAVKALYK